MVAKHSAYRPRSVFRSRLASSIDWMISDSAALTTGMLTYPVPCRIALLRVEMQ